jgi:two-component sensor histidine kinase
LQHRIKNTLAMVQSIANQTMRNAGSLTEARNAFGARLLALSHAHDVLTESSWAAAPIATVVEGALAPHRPPNARRIRANGPVIQLEAKPAMALALALHELATNAVKYGALSNESGMIELLWSCEPGPACEMFRLTWREQGGPPVTPPSQKGFGTRLIERGLAGEFGGTVVLSYEPAGVVCTIEAPLPKAVH